LKYYLSLQKQFLTFNQIFLEFLSNFRKREKEKENGNDQLALD